MKLEKWALGAEIVGATAIVITLIILIVEVRGNSDAIRAQTISAQVDRELERRRWIFLNEGGIADLVLKSRSGAPISEAERFRLARYYVSLLDSFEWQYREVRADRLPESVLNVWAWQGLWRDDPMMKDRWELTKGIRDPAFVEYWEANVVNSDEIVSGRR